MTYHWAPLIGCLSLIGVLIYRSQELRRTTVVVSDPHGLRDDEIALVEV